MPATPILGLPYPAETDPADVPKDVQALADKLDATVLPATHPANLQPGDLVVSAAGNRAGCLICDGAPVSRATYAALFAAIGTAYGVGDGSATFNVPDYRGRAILGAGAGPGLTARNRGDRIGEEAHALTIAELASHHHDLSVSPHTHTVNDAGHTHGAYVNTASWGQYPWVPVIDSSAWNADGYTRGPINYAASSGGRGLGPASLNHGHSAGTQAAATGIGLYPNNDTIGMYDQGSSNGHNNMPPAAVANVFIKT